MRNKILLLTLCSLFLLSSCATQQKTENKAYQFFRENPAKLAELCADNYPPVIKTVQGATIIKRDTVEVEGPELPCPEVPGQKTVYIKCPPTKTYRDTIYRTDTITVQNTAQVEELNLKLSKEHDARILAEAQSDEKTKYMWLSLILFIALISLIAKRVL